MARRRLLSLGLVGTGLVVGLAGCTQPSNTPTSYDDQTRANYIAGCTGGFEGSNTSLAPRSACQCQYDFFVANVSMSDFEKLQNDINKDPASGDATKYNDKLKECASGEHITPAGTAPSPATTGPATTGPATTGPLGPGSSAVGPLAPESTAKP